MALIQDLFPGVEIPNVDYGTLQKAVERQLTIGGLQPVPSYVSKIIQLFETMLVRHGVMLVGLTLTGKSTNSLTLCNALTQLKRDGDENLKGFYEVVKRHILNPKSVLMGELYGEVNMTTQEWTDGLVPTLVRASVNDETDNLNWVMFDGPVDALWIENMNTVLDDNKMLCLSNGERIKLAKSMHMLFEVNDLSVASPVQCQGHRTAPALRAALAARQTHPRPCCGARAAGNGLALRHGVHGSRLHRVASLHHHVDDDGVAQEAAPARATIGVAPDQVCVACD
jgi:hypothetical protein